MFKWIAQLFGRSARPEPPEFVALKREYPTIHDAATRFMDSFGPGFTNTESGHIATDIAGAACIAGSDLLRYAEADISSLPAESVLLSEAVDERLENLFRFVRVAAYQLGLSSTMDSVEVPPQHQPLFETAEFVEKLRVPFANACREFNVNSDFHAHVGVLTAMRFVKAGDDMGLLDQEIGKSLVGQFLVAGAKTVPLQELRNGVK